jgi:hypothetical protein
MGDGSTVGSLTKELGALTFANRNVAPPPLLPSFTESLPHDSMQCLVTRGRGYVWGEGGEPRGGARAGGGRSRQRRGDPTLRMGPRCLYFF